MYRSFSAIWDGWSKSLFPLLEKKLSRVITAILFAIVNYLLPLAVLAISAVLMILGKYIVGGLGIMVALLAMIAIGTGYNRNLRENNFPIWSMVFLPLGAIILIALLTASVYRHKTATVGWKGRTYANQ
jgi:hypothetical protein